MSVPVKMGVGPDETRLVTREYALLLRSAQPRPSGHRLPHRRQAGEGSVDIDALIRMSHWHGLTPPLLEYVSVRGGVDIPRAAVDRLRSAVHANIGHNLKTVGALRQLVSTLNNEDIPFLLFKGPITSLDAYGSIAGRPFVDLDLLIQPSDIRRAVEALQKLSFVPEFLEDARTGEVRLLQYHLPMRHVEGGKMVELHWRVVPRYFPFHFDYEGMWSRRRTCNVLGTAVPAPSQEDAVLFHCVHAAKHGWMRLEWVSTLGHLMVKADGPDWSSVLEQARKAGVKDIVWFGLLLSENILNIPIPDSISKLSEAKGYLQPMVADVESRLPHAHEGPLRDHWADFKLHLRLRERVADRLRYVGGLLFYPTIEDWQAVRLPSSLHALYYLVHPARMLLEHGSTLLDTLRGKKVV